MRILVADDDHNVLHAYSLCLDPVERETAREVDRIGNDLFEGSVPVGNIGPRARWSQVDYVSQGKEAVRVVTEARAKGDPVGVVFLDMMMPPGIDGRETARLMRQADPDLNIVIVTGYSDHSPADICEVAGPEDKIFFLAKPFETIEIKTLANALSAKWTLERSLATAQIELAAKVAALETANTELAASEARCRHVAMHDHLTQLPNRSAFLQFLDHQLADANHEVAVLFVDLDRFKHVNDTLGHAAGDELICTVAARLSAVLPDKTMLARLGGDEFGIVLHGGNAEKCAEWANTVSQASSGDIEILGIQVRIGASIGVSRRDRAVIRSSELLRRADLALYAAKAKGRNRAEMFEPSFDESARKRSEVECRLRQAIAENTLRLAFQPIHDPAGHEPVGFEALLRWDDAVLGTISPSIFVPIAEETGVIIELGEWVIRKSLDECATWTEGFVSINLSTRHFQSPALVDLLVEEASRHSLPHNRIQLEITETALFDDPQLAAATLVRMRQLGFRIALDDFGTGYSSLVNLKDFEIDCIKIDQSFVSRMGSDPTSLAIIQAVTGLARALGLKVVAEGVETELQVQALRLTGCELMQGYYFGAAQYPGTILGHEPFDMARKA